MKQRGSLLIIVLWSLFFLSSLALAINRYVWPRLDLAAKLIRRAKMYNLLQSGVKRAILEIKYDPNLSYDSLNEAWAVRGGLFAGQTGNLEQQELGDGVFDWGLSDEESKININKAPRSVLENLFEAMAEISSQDAADLASAVIDWRDEDDDPGEGGAEGGYYSVMKFKYPSKNAEFEVLEELLLVKGMTESIFSKVKDSLTVFGRGAVNINTAEEAVLRALGMEEELAEKVMHFRNGYDSKPGTADDNIFEDVGNIAMILGEQEKMTGPDNSRILKLVGDGLLAVSSDNFQGSCRAKLKNRSDTVKVSFVFDRSKNSLVYWRPE